MTRDVVYRCTDGVNLTLDVYRATNLLPAAPIVIYYHGGGFSMLSKETHWLMAMLFAHRGFVVFNIDYRLAPKWVYPAAIEDACAAYCWVVQNAAHYGGDPQRIVLAGESAGGNLALAVTLAACFERPESFARAVYDLDIVPRATLPACPLLEVSSVERYDAPGKAIEFERGILRDVRYSYARYLEPHPTRPTLADPLLILEGVDIPTRPIPPVCTVVGTWDCLKDDCRRLEAALSKRSGTCQVHYYPRGLHAFHAFLFLPSARRCWRDQFAFIERYL